MQYQSFSYTPTDMAEQLTGATHDTLSWLWRHEYITKEDYEELTNQLVVMAIPNKKGFGKRLLERFFGTKDDENIWVFPIVEVADHYRNANPNTPKNVTKLNAKPKLEVVDNEKTD